MRRAYPADADLTVVVDRLSSGRHGSIPGDTAVVQSLMSQEKSLKLENGFLYQKFVPANPGSQVTWQLIVPRQQRPLLFQEAPAGATSGHFANKRTLEKLCQLTYWPGMSRDIEEWCRSCDMCAKRWSPGSQSQNRAPMGHTAATTPLRAANQVWLNTPAINQRRTSAYKRAPTGPLAAIRLNTTTVENHTSTLWWDHHLR